MKAENVNPFIISVCKVMKDMCMLNLQMGKPIVATGEYPQDNFIIKLGINGNLTGSVLLSMEHSTALEIVSKMMMTPVNTIDAIGQSAISELGNMIAGNAATVFANSDVLIDITTPAYYVGSEYRHQDGTLFRVPFSSEVGSLSIDVQINGDD